MVCRKVKPLLIRFLEGDISEKVVLEIEEHLKSCPACRMERDRLAGSWDLLDRYETPRVSSDFTYALMRRIHSEPASADWDETASDPTRWRFSWRLVSGLAACVVVAVAIAMLRHDSFEHDAARTAPSHPEGSARTLTDAEIIRNLDIYENVDLLQNLGLLSDMDVIENIDRSGLRGNPKGNEK